MSCLGLLLLRLANQNKGDHSHEKTPYLSFIIKCRGLSSQIQRTSTVLAALLWGLSLSHTHLCKSHRVLQQMGTLGWKGLIFPGYTVRKMTLFGSVISSLEKISSQYQDSAKTGRDLPGLALTCQPVFEAGCQGFHLTAGPGKGKAGLATGCQRLAINPCQCWVPTAMWSSSKMPESWKWGTWEVTTWPMETAKNLCMASSKSLKGKAGHCFEPITCFTDLTC